MRVLISAYACEPHFGSEGAVGWEVRPTGLENLAVDVVRFLVTDKIVPERFEKFMFILLLELVLDDCLQHRG